MISIERDDIARQSLKMLGKASLLAGLIGIGGGCHASIVLVLTLWRRMVL